jgi:phosphomevalonate kinase
MISGEYAVLRGAPALVAAVGARAEASWSAAPVDGSADASIGSPEKSSLPPEAVLARQRAEKEVGQAVPHELRIDVTPLRRSGKKLGLGSSAAAAAAAVAAVYAWSGRDIARLEVRREVLRQAFEGHRAIAPQGSGADVAAAVLGGVVRFRRAGEGFEAEPVNWPRGLEARLVWTGKEARTSDFVARIGELERTSPALFREAMGRLETEAAAFATAFGEGDAPTIIAATARYHEAMRALGEAAGVAIVEDKLARVAELARAAGGAAKPSGAGGGDVAIAFFAGSEARARFDGACRSDGMTLLDLQLGADGVRPLQGEPNDART